MMRYMTIPHPDILKPEQVARIKKWIAMLRSGEFEQTRGTLRKGGTYCCLGVECELFRRETGLGEWRLSYSTALEEQVEEFIVNDSEKNSETLYLPPDVVRDWSGLNIDIEAMGSTMNDNGFSFTQIADAFERWLETGESFWNKHKS